MGMETPRSCNNIILKTKKQKLINNQPIEAIDISQGD